MSDSVRCYDCRQDFPLHETVAVEVATGRSEATWNRVASTHYGNVDLCFRCNEIREKKGLYKIFQGLCVGAGIVVGVLLWIMTKNVFTLFLGFFPGVIGGLVLFTMSENLRR